jgi:enediyne biosynthesis protein E4
MQLTVTIRFALLVLLTGAIQCQPKQVSDVPQAPTDSATLFALLPAEQTGLDFKNTLIENTAINYHTDKYIYNGGGVAAGDVNNDGLTDLYLVSNLYSNKLFLNQGALKFQDITTTAEASASRGFKTSAVMADVNADGWLDIYVCRGHHPDSTLRNDLLYLNNGPDATGKWSGKFTESAAQWGIRDGAHTTQVAFFDADLDGDLDFYQMNHPFDFDQAVLVRLAIENSREYRKVKADNPQWSDKFYRNDGGRFTEVGTKVGIDNQAFGLGLAITDVNADGYPDVYVGNDFVEPDFLYVNNGRGQFTEQWSRYFKHSSHNTMGVDFADINNDGLEDMVSLDMLPADNYRQKILATSMSHTRYQTLLRYGYEHQFMRNMLQVNNGNGTFSDVGELAGIAKTDWSWSALMADFDLDGQKDIFISNGIRRDLTNMDFIDFKSDAAQKSAAQGQPLITDQNFMQWIEKIPTQKQRNYGYKNEGELRFSDRSVEWGLSQAAFSNGAVAIDLDNDGDLDLVVNNLEDPVFCYENKAVQQIRQHFIGFKFKGSTGNPQGVGARVQIWNGAHQQVQTVKTARGFLSGTTAELHFGLGQNTVVDSMVVRWPDGRTQTLTQVKADQWLTLQYADAKPVRRSSFPQLAAIWRADPGCAGINFSHKESDFDDFLVEPLLPHGFARQGPCLAKADVNGDGLDDLFTGGAAGQSGQLWLQQKNGRFTPGNSAVFAAAAASEDVEALFFDANNDQKNDLLVVSGSNEFPEGDPRYQPRLYLNDGRGNFTLATTALPTLTGSCKAAAVADVDRDGDRDIFMGGRVTPGRYPVIPRSYLLINEQGQFKDQTAQIAPDLAQVGMVTDAFWMDFNGDQFPELVLCGEWMPLMVWQNEGGRKLINQTSSNGLLQSEGWWNCALPFDWDGDGDMDIVAGNFGENTLLKATLQEPIELFAADFDQNGTIEPILCNYVQGKSWPFPRKEVLQKQLPMLKKKFLLFDQYAQADLRTLLPAAELDKSQQLKAYTLASSVAINLGNGQFKLESLNSAAQWSSVHTLLAVSPDELLMAGNAADNEVEIAPTDAGYGLYFQRDNTGRAQVLPLKESGFFTPDVVRDLALIQHASGEKSVFVARNGATLQRYTKAADKRAY